MASAAGGAGGGIRGLRLQRLSSACVNWRHGARPRLLSLPPTHRPRWPPATTQAGVLAANIPAFQFVLVDCGGEVGVLSRIRMSSTRIMCGCKDAQLLYILTFGFDLTSCLLEGTEWHGNRASYPNLKIWHVKYLDFTEQYADSKIYAYLI